MDLTYMYFKHHMTYFRSAPHLKPTFFHRQIFSPSLTSTDNNTCAVNNGGCEQNCTNLPDNQGHVCHCNDGFSVSRDDKTSCEDVDECGVWGNNCPQNCLNVKVSRIYLKGFKQASQRNLLNLLKPFFF